jgi:hypothetical protein
MSSGRLLGSLHSAWTVAVAVLGASLMVVTCATADETNPLDIPSYPGPDGSSFGGSASGSAGSGSGGLAGSGRGGAPNGGASGAGTGGASSAGSGGLAGSGSGGAGGSSAGSGGASGSGTGGSSGTGTDGDACPPDRAHEDDPCPAGLEGKECQWGIFDCVCENGQWNC